MEELCSQKDHITHLEMVSYKKWSMKRNLKVPRTKLGDVERKGTAWTEALKKEAFYCVPGITSSSVFLEHKLWRSGNY